MGYGVLPLGHPKVGTNQTSGSVFEKALSRCEQRASREPPEEFFLYFFFLFPATKYSGEMHYNLKYIILHKQPKS